MAQKIKDPGVGVLSSSKAQRYVNTDGSFNIQHENRKASISESYSYLINLSWPRFFLCVFIGYIIVNTFFAIVYLLLGIENIESSSGNFITDFSKAFFFSVQTLTTVGYGVLAPKGIGVSIVASIEALVGLMSFSFVTGLLYGRFSRPKSNIRFSDTLVLREHQDSLALMFRMMSKGKHVMIYPKVEVILVLSEKGESNMYNNKFFNLALERSQITYLPTTWTIVHELKDTSPLAGYTKEELVDLHAELLIVASYYDESFKQEVHQIHSYIFQQIAVDHKFEKAFYYDDRGHIVLDHSKLDKTKSI
ncbi:ion channel [Aquimarina rhabdastrellae]